ncbi:PssD/Cps14F family polysaccharide biosynthesis glycosyltransferase [Clostridium sp. K04]|uniref:PssD/Cps14F family polysaccharide biosynthesis glycosyltransferase n=1 Tax=Clostridium sp. K04 TaxID=2718929 RepID=UPI001C8CC895|nr:PssD/Cps14F family polysaccharide biosynthesis glycosyltransferase [Clostridium sp. K04]MBX9186041.1 polysaccharide biosynthesis protein [Clostridium sp. K04]
MNKICFIASTGGHFEQLMMLKPLMDKYESFIVTEKTEYSVIEDDRKIYYLNQVNRHEKTFIFKMALNFIKSLNLFIKERPDVVISTGALATIPMCIFAKVFKKKIIFIESFAKVNSPTLTGKLVYKFADQFYVQWEQMKEHYPNAIFRGGIY